RRPPFPASMAWAEPPRSRSPLRRRSLPLAYAVRTGACLPHHQRRRRQLAFRLLLLGWRLPRAVPSGQAPQPASRLRFPPRRRSLLARAWLDRALLAAQTSVPILQVSFAPPSETSPAFRSVG